MERQPVDGGEEAPYAEGGGGYCVAISRFYESKKSEKIKKIFDGEGYSKK